MSATRERLEALLVDEAIGDLSTGGKQELEDLLRKNPGVDRYAFEKAASAVFLAGCISARTPMPVHLNEKIVAAGRRLVSGTD